MLIVSKLIQFWWSVYLSRFIIRDFVLTSRTPAFSRKISSEASLFPTLWENTPFPIKPPWCHQFWECLHTNCRHLLTVTGSRFGSNFSNKGLEPPAFKRARNSYQIWLELLSVYLYIITRKVNQFKRMVILSSRKRSILRKYETQKSHSVRVCLRLDPVNSRFPNDSRNNVVYYHKLIEFSRTGVVFSKEFLSCYKLFN